jgi:two-component SAPR family response regulator
MLSEIGYNVPDNATRYSEAIELIENEKPDLLLLGYPFGRVKWMELI